MKELKGLVHCIGLKKIGKNMGKTSSSNAWARSCDSFENSQNHATLILG